MRRSRRFIAWEYAFAFGGGSPPWMSGMAQATGIQALARAAKLLDEPRYLDIAREALGAFETRPPTGVRTSGPAGGVHYLQYSFAPRLYIFNAFLQSLIGLRDFGRLAGETPPLSCSGVRPAHAGLPLSDVGDWSRYSYAGAESNRDYHELLREFLQSMCTRRLGSIYCEFAKRYLGYQTDPPELQYTGPAGGTENELIPLRFTVSKLWDGQFEVRVLSRRKLVFSRLATFRRGTGAFAWRPAGPELSRWSVARRQLRTGLAEGPSPGRARGRERTRLSQPPRMRAFSAANSCIRQTPCSLRSASP